MEKGDNMKKLVAITLSGMFIMSSAFAFSDLPENHWAYENVVNMQNKGIVSGFEDNTFRPSDTLTRAQFITMAAKGLGLTNNEGMSFVDVHGGHWAFEYIQAAGNVMAESSTLMNGFEFRPNESALREDVAMAIVMLNGLEDVEYDLSILNQFSDSDRITEELKKYVAIAVEHGFMSVNADGTFKPQDALSRAEGATVIANMLSKKSAIESVANWNGEFISNIDGITKVKLTKLSDTEVNSYIKGKKTSTFGINNIAVITGNIAKYEYDMFEEKRTIELSFEGTDLIIKTEGYEELNVFNGRYKVDDGTISSIVKTTERNPLEGNYLLGEKMETPEVETMEELQKVIETAPLSLTFEISNIGETTATYTLGGFVDESMVARMGSLEKHGDKWRDVDEYEEGSTIEVEFVDGNVVITGLVEDSEKLTGTYIKQVESLEDEFEKVEEEVDSMEVGEGALWY